MEYTLNQYMKTKRYQHVSGWTWKQLDLNQLCQKSPQTPIGAQYSLLQPYIENGERYLQAVYLQW